MELEAAAEQEEAGTKREIEEVKERLDKLEETIREVAAEAKGKSSAVSHGKLDTYTSREVQKSPEHGPSSKGLEPGISAVRSPIIKEGKSSSKQVPASSQKDQ